MRYKTPRALEQAVKEAARGSGRDVNRAITDFYHDRLLERVFSEQEPSFVLKGGRGMLARTASARYTKDTDMAYEGGDIDEAVTELRRLAAIDLGDHLEYRFSSALPIVEEQEYREGCCVTFEAILGGAKKVTDVSVDLVVNDAPLARTDIMAPATRLPIDGLAHFDYVVYPVEESVTDKVCATMATYRGGRRSSRVRDLVDLAIYLTTEEMDGAYLGRCLSRELRMGHMGESALSPCPRAGRRRTRPHIGDLRETAGSPRSFGRWKTQKTLSRAAWTQRWTARRSERYGTQRPVAGLIMGAVRIVLKRQALRKGCELMEEWRSQTSQ